MAAIINFLGYNTFILKLVKALNFLFLNNQQSKKVILQQLKTVKNSQSSIKEVGKKNEKLELD